jgi:IS5 family transposase
VAVVLGQQTERQATRLHSQAEEILPLVKQVIAQTRRRVLEGKKVPSDQKVLSLFEPHTRCAGYFVYPFQKRTLMTAQPVF